ncbi:hypothetical protein GCM10028820_12100 [Tessaracoccus terricola]
MHSTAQLRHQGQQFPATLWTTERQAHLRDKPDQLCELRELLGQVKSQIEGLELDILTDANSTTNPDRIADTHIYSPAAKPHQQRHSRHP